MPGPAETWTSRVALEPRGRLALYTLALPAAMSEVSEIFTALAGTAEAIRPRGFGEGGMIFLLPMEGFPLLLVASGIVRLIRGEGSKA